MRQQLRQSTWQALVLISLIILVSACGSSKRGNLYSGAPTGNQNVIPTFDLPMIGAGSSQNTSIVNNLISVTAYPGLTVSTGTTVYVVPSGGSSASYNFELLSNPIGATFVGGNQGVPHVGLTSSTPGSVSLRVTATSGGTSSAPTTIAFTGSTSSPVTSSACRIEGPYAISGSSSPQVGGSYYFSVKSNLDYVSDYQYGYSQNLKILNVWTLDSSEIGRYYYAWDKFWMTLNSGGSKTIFVRAQSLTSGAICDAQLTLSVAGPYVTPTPGPVPGESCGLTPATGLGYCSQVASYTYYYDGFQCQAIWTENSCRAKGQFQSLYACQQAVAAGQCSGGQGTNVTRQVSVDSRSSQWIDSGVDVYPSASSILTITASGSISYNSSTYGASTGPNGFVTSFDDQCKVPSARSFGRAALIGKIGVDGTPFLVGSNFSASVQYSSGRLYLIVNDANCASNNSGSFLATIQFQRGYYSGPR